MIVKIALYKGPPTTQPRLFAHRAICSVTKGPYSHCELIDAEGWGWSSSYWDGGVRRKQVDFNSGRWDVIEVEGDREKAVAWFEANNGEPYGWWGLLAWLLPFRLSDAKHPFCSSCIAMALDRPNAWKVSPNDMAGWRLSGETT